MLLKVMEEQHREVQFLYRLGKLFQACKTKKLHPQRLVNQSKPMPHHELGKLQLNKLPSLNSRLGEALSFLIHQGVVVLYRWLMKPKVIWQEVNIA